MFISLSATQSIEDVQAFAYDVEGVVKYRDDDIASIVLAWFIQVTALAAAITFGIFSVLSWTVAENAKEQANTANLVALAALCSHSFGAGANYNAEVHSFCGQLVPRAWNSIANAVAKSMPDLGDISAPSIIAASSSASVQPSSSASSSGPPSSGLPSGAAPSSSFVGSSKGHAATSTARPTHTVGASPSSGSAGGLGTGAKIGLGVGFAIGVPMVLVTLLTFLRHRKSRGEKII